MLKARMARALIAIAVAVMLPATALAQADSDALEGTEWHLTTYAAGTETAAVPWTVDATLELSAGVANGSSGCNDFAGSYVLSGDGLVVDPAFAMTQQACPEPEAAVETGYLASLPLVATWAITDDTLQLADADGSVILEFEQPVGSLTPSDIAAIAAQFQAQATALERLDQRLDNVSIPTLRDRIKTLESEVAALQASAAAAAKAGTGGSKPASYSSAEKTLLKGIPASIRSTCSSLRGNNLPGGTVAAVQCAPRSGPVAEMAYYLMEYSDALATMRSVMNANSVRRGYACYLGNAGFSGVSSPTPFQVEGCFISGGKANLRFIDTATECHRLNVDGSQMRMPMIYVAAESKTDKIKPLTRWARTATRDLSYTPYDVIRTIPFGNQPADGCP